MSNPDDWCTIESDPGVFTSLLEKLECPHVELTELWSLDADSLAVLQSETTEVYGLIFLFEYKKSNRTVQHKQVDDLFFAHQIATNACATQAILSVVLNRVPQLGPHLSEFKDFVSSFPPDLKGTSIASSEVLRKAHNSFARPDAFVGDALEQQQQKLRDPDASEAFHFVAYIPHTNGNVYELDGLQPTPILVQDNVEEDWLSVAAQTIQNRMADVSGKFNVMAVIADKRLGLSKDDDNVRLQELNTIRHNWMLENVRRAHNYVPFAVQMLQELARLDELSSLVDQNAKGAYGNGQK